MGSAALVNIWRADYRMLAPTNGERSLARQTPAEENPRLRTFRPPSNLELLSDLMRDLMRDMMRDMGEHFHGLARVYA